MHIHGAVFSPDSGETGDVVEGSRTTEGNITVTEGTTGGGQQGEFVPAEELVRLRTQAEKAGRLAEDVAELQRTWQHTQNLLRSGVDPGVLEESIRHVMSRAGHSQGDIDDYVRSLRSGGQESGTVDENIEPKGGSKGEELEGDEVGGLRKEIEALQQQMVRQKQDALVRELNASVERALDTTEGFGTLLDRASQVDGKDDKDASANRRRLVLDDIRRETTDLLRQRRAKNGGNWSDAWIPEEANRAAVAVLKKFRAVAIGDPSRLGRAPETEAGEDVWTTRKPVPAPEYKPGMTPDAAQAQVRDYAVDHLLRGLREGEGGTSKI